MKSILMAFIVMAVIALGSTAYAAASCNGTHNCNTIGGGAGGDGGNATVRNSGNSSNTNRNTNHNSNFGINKQGQGQAQGQSSSNTNGSNVSIGGDNYDDNYKPTASTAYAPALAASAGTCLGSVSAGASTVPFGISIGGTTKDNDCNVRKDAAILFGFGMKLEAIRRMCLGSDEMYAAIGDKGCTAVGAGKKKEVSFFENDTTVD